MYQSSSGELKDPKVLDTSYLINALAKSYREIWNSLTETQCKMYLNNIIVLKTELDLRINSFAINKFGGNENE